MRLKNTDEYVNRISKSIITGYGTVYSPGDHSIMYCARKDNAILGYLLGVQNNNSVIMYETKGSSEIVYEILIKIQSDFSPQSIFLNLPDSKESYDFLNNFFSKYAVNKPNITMFYNRDENVFEELKNIYIPFTDRI
jgi:hypothetical protein